MGPVARGVDYLSDERIGKLTSERLRQHLASSGKCTPDELTRATTKFALVSIAEEVRRLRLPTLRCSYRCYDEARTALRSYPFVTTQSSADENTIILGVQKEDDCPIVTAMAGLRTGGDEESVSG